MATRLRTLANDRRYYFTDVGVAKVAPRTKPFRLSEPSRFCAGFCRAKGGLPTGAAPWLVERSFVNAAPSLQSKPMMS